MVRQVAPLSTIPCARRQISPAALWGENLQGRGILMAMFHEGYIERNMRSLSRASRRCISSTRTRLLTARSACLPLDYHPSRRRQRSERFQVVSCSGQNEDK